MAPTRTSSSLRIVARWELTLQQHTTTPKPAAPPPVQAVALAVQQRCPCRPPLRQHAAAGQVCGGAQARAHRALPIRRDEAQAAGSGALAAFLQGQRRHRDARRHLTQNWPYQERQHRLPQRKAPPTQHCLYYGPRQKRQSLCCPDASI